MKIKRHSWGTSVCLFEDDRYSLWLAKGSKGGESSTHDHCGKSNTFVVLSGEIVVINDNVPCTIGENQSLTVPPLRRHRMIFEQDSVILELYHALDKTILDPEDIRRYDNGKSPIG